MGRAPSIAWCLLLVMGACRSPESVAAPAPSAPSPVDAASAAPVPACPIWPASSFQVVAKTSGPRGDEFRELDFDDATGVVAVHDSDVFVDGQEVQTPRVLQTSRTLTAEEHAALRRSLTRICPDAAALARTCAPGTCYDLVVTAGGTTTHLQDADTVIAIMALLEPFFPALRR